MNVFYQHKKMIEYCGYRIIIFQSSIKSVSKYIISIFNGKERIGKIECNNDVQTITSIKPALINQRKMVAG